MARIEKWDEVHGTQAPDERMMAFLDSTTGMRFCSFAAARIRYMNAFRLCANWNG